MRSCNTTTRMLRSHMETPCNTHTLSALIPTASPISRPTIRSPIIPPKFMLQSANTARLSSKTRRRQMLRLPMTTLMDSNIYQSVLTTLLIRSTRTLSLTWLSTIPLPLPHPLFLFLRRGHQLLSQASAKVAPPRVRLLADRPANGKSTRAASGISPWRNIYLLRMKCEYIFHLMLSLVYVP